MSESEAHALPRLHAAPAPRAGRERRRLLREARKGSPGAIDSVIDLYWDGAQRLAYSILGDSAASEDVAQESMIAVLKNIGRFDARRPFEPWLHRIVVNRALDWSRAEKRRGELPASSLPQAGGMVEIADARGGSLDETGSDAPELEAMLARLSPEHRAVITLRFRFDYSDGDIAQMLEIPRGTVGSRLRRALDQLRQEMESQ